MQAGTVCHLRLAPLPWPPRLQEGQQHLDPTDNDRLALFSLKHVTQELLDGLLPEGRESRVKDQVPGHPQDKSLPRPQYWPCKPTSLRWPTAGLAPGCPGLGSSAPG